MRPVAGASGQGMGQQAVERCFEGPQEVSLALKAQRGLEVLTPLWVVPISHYLYVHVQ